MISHGGRLATLKRDAINYITQKVKDHKAYRNRPGDLIITSGNCYVVEEKVGNMMLGNLSIERVCAIADKIHFRPLGEVKNLEVIVKEVAEVSIEKTNDMNIEIKSNIPLPTKVVGRGRPVSTDDKKGKVYFNYRALPLKDMKVGQCIIIFDNVSPEELMRRVYRARQGVRSFVALMDTQKRFYVDKTSDGRVAVWRIE